MKKIFLFTSLILITFFSNVFAQPITLSTTNITNTGAQLNWDASPCTGNVTLHYKEAGNGWPGTVVNPATSPEILTGLDYNTDYEWRVKCSGSGNPWSPTESFSTPAPTISNAFISYPIQCHGIYNTDSMQIDISQTTPPTTYACVVGTVTGGFFLKFVSTNQTTTTQISLNGFNPNVDYWVRLVDSTAYFTANPNGNGTSTVGIYDEFGPINFSEPAQLTANTSIVASNLCAGDCIAEEDLTISGGTMPYSFDITSSTGTTTQNLASGVSSYSFAALCADTYNVLVTDANGCSTSPPITTFSIAVILPISPLGTVSPASCFGASDGEINASATGGTGGFTYSIDGTNFQTGPTFSNLSQGIYTVTYKDQNDCIATEVLVVNQPPDLSGIANITSAINCYGAPTGEITFFVDPVNSGTPGYQYSLDGGITLQSSNVFAGLTGDSTYNVMIQDNNGCQFISTVFLAQPAEITYSMTLSNYNGFEVSCFGASDGEINTAATGGTGAISYSIDGTNFQLSGVFSGLPAGGYTVTYQDANGCAPTDQLALTEPGDFTIPFVFSNDIDCPGDCDGAISINPSNGVGTVLYSLDAGTQQTTPSFSGLCGDITHGSYTLDAIDDNGCTATLPVAISEPGPFVYTTSSISETCAPPNGEASISVTSGGTGAPAYLWDDSNTQTTATATGLVAGTYQVTVTDGNLCSFTEAVVVTSAPSFSLSFTTISPCLGPTSGSATVSVSAGASGTLSYVWYDGNGTPIFSGGNTLDNVGVGTYSVDVIDGSGCTISGSVNITPPINPIMFDTLIITNNSCYGIDDAQIEIIVSGGQQPYSYSNGFPPPQSNPVFVYLAPDSYTITATDLNGCYVDTVIDIVYPGLLQIDSTYFTNVSCNGANDAEILAIDVSGGTAPFEYSVDGSTHYSNMSYFNGYGPGTYTVEVYDANNCVGADYIIITEPAELDVDITTSGWVYNPNSGLYSYQIKCYGDNSGFADLVINGGTAPYTRNLYDATTGLLITSTNLNSFTGLTAGEYDFEVVDANGCIYSETILFSQPPTITHNFIPTHVTCSGWSNGSLTDIVSGGVGDATSYIYAWDTGDSTYTIDSIAVGIYTMTVIDENNCVSVDSFPINDNDMLTVSSSSQNVSCYDYCDGEISAIVVGGLPNYDANGIPIYTYQWNDILSQTTETAIGLCADNNANSTEYSCVITDSQGCVDTIYQIIYQPDSLHVSAIITSDYNFADISCYGASDGKLKATAVGGNPGYSYAWTGPGNYTGTGANAIGLVAGSYTVVATDLNGCLDTTEITLTEPGELAMSVSQININCFGIYDGQIIAVVDSGGTPFFGIPPMYNYSFSNGFNEQTDTSTAVDLAPGLYTVTATDQNGCSITSGSIFISQPADPLTIDLDSIDESCTGDNGVIMSEVSGGTEPYNYNWNDGWSTLDTIYDLEPGIYFIEVIDDNGCVVNDTIRVVGKDEVFLPSYISSFDTTICLGETFELNVQEKLDFRYIWEHENNTLLDTPIVNLANDHADIIVTPDNDTNIYTLTIIDISCAVADTFQVAATIYATSIDPQITSFPGLEYGNYPVVLKGNAIELSSSPTGTPATPPFTYNWILANDTIANTSLITVNDLQESSTYYLIVQDNQGCLGFDSIYVVVGVLPYEAITPNGDGYNDTWTPRDITSYENALVQVFNRWGALVFESKGGLNYQAWDGSNNGEELPVGTYYYIIDLNTGDEPQTGPITIIR